MRLHLCSRLGFGYLAAEVLLSYLPSRCPSYHGSNMNSISACSVLQHLVNAGSTLGMVPSWSSLSVFAWNWNQVCFPVNHSDWRHHGLFLLTPLHLTPKAELSRYRSVESLHSFGDPFLATDVRSTCVIQKPLAPDKS